MRCSGLRRTIASVHPTQRTGDSDDATTQFADWERFWSVFSTVGAEKRAEHGCKGALVFRDDSAADHVWVAFDWDDAGWQSFVSDPTVPTVMKDAGHLAKPYALTFHGAVEA